MPGAIQKPAMFWVGMVAAMLIIGTPSAWALESENYGYIRTLEGYADLIESQTDSVVKLTTNHPVGVGDQLRISDGGRVETVRPDGRHLRLGENTELEFNRLAQTTDSLDDTTLILLHQGEAQLVSLRSPYESEAFRIDTANSTIYIQQQGTYLILTDGDSWTNVSVRQGQIKLVTESGSSVAQAGETIFVEGARDPRVWVEQAGQLSALERWGDELTESSRTYASQYVDPSLAYASTPLTRHGSWMKTESKYVWRPNVSRGWRPYHSGWWTRTPSGLTWGSTEPWGWLTYHYGVWNYGPSYGWVWHPGTTDTPAAVHWYWGPTHVGWIPSGYYTSDYGQHYPRFDDWTFTRHRHLGRRGAHSYLRTGEQLANQGIFEQSIPDGIIATDTRALTPDLWHQPSRAMEVLRASGDRDSLLKPGVVVRDGGDSGLSSRRSVAETWRLDSTNEAPSRIWGSDLRQRRQERRPVVGSSSSPTVLPIWQDIRTNRQNSRQTPSTRSERPGRAPSSSLTQSRSSRSPSTRSTTSRHRRPSSAQPGRHLGRSSTGSSRSGSMGSSSRSSSSGGMQSSGGSRSSSSGSSSSSGRPSRPNN